MSFNFRGKKVLVTGAGQGIGRGVAVALNQSGCKVYALSRTKSSLDSLVEEYPDIIPIVADLCEWKNTKVKIKELEVLDGLVNNAGISGHDFTCLDTPKEYINHILDNNLLSTISCTQIVAKKMIEAKVKGSIVNVSSIVSLAAFPMSLAYSVSKAGMDMVTKQFALELGPHEIRVNSINPALVKTPLVESLIEKGMLTEERSAARMPTGRLLRIEEVVDPILYLLSDHSAMVTGHLHIVDGGFMSNITAKL